MAKRATKKTAPTSRPTTKKVVRKKVAPSRKSTALDLNPERFPVYFRSLTVRNIRCFGDEPQTLNLSTPDGKSWAHWTLILGNNGTGKSTLLQLMNLVATRKDDENRTKNDNYTESASCELVFDHSVSLGSFERIEKKGLTSSRSGTGTPVNHEVTASFYAGYDGVSDGSLCAMTFDACNMKWGRFLTDAPNTYSGRIAVFGRSKTGRSSVGLLQFGYGAWRRVGQSTLSPEPGRERGVSSHLFDDTNDLINAEEWLQRLDYSAAKSKVNSIHTGIVKKRDAVLETLQLILPEVEKIEVTNPTKEFPNPRVLFTTPYGDVELRQLGFGYQSLISWVVDFAARLFEAYPDSPDPLAEPAVCLVDEIDLHLHPSWQRKVMKYLSDRFPKTQFIATAHSPLIVQAAPEIGANVVVLRREGDHVVISNNPIDVRGWRADQILSSELFDEQPLRADEIQQQMDERTQILSKSKLTARDRERLKTLNAVADELPVGSTAEERNVAELLKKTVDLLKGVTAEKP